MKYSSILSKLSLCLFCLLAASPLAAQQREWTSSDGKTQFKAELVNAYGDTVYFLKEDGGYIHLPIVLLSKPDVARILEWADERDAAEQCTLYASQAKATKEVCNAWLNSVVGEELKDADLSKSKEPYLYVFLMIQQDTPRFRDLAFDLAKAENNLNGNDGNFIKTIAITPFNGDDIKPVIQTLGKSGGKWLMQNEWTYKDKKEMWNGFWRKSAVNVLITDPQGHVLCDSAAKEPDGKSSDVIAFLNKMMPIAKSLNDGGKSVPNPYINEQAIKDLLARELEAKTNSPGPRPIAFDFSGVDPEIFKTMEGNDYVISVMIGTDGNVSNLVLKKGGDATVEKALKQAATFWRFVPVLKDGVPVAKTVGIPLRIKAPKQTEQPAEK